MNECQDCKHCVTGYDDILCVRLKDAISCGTMRDDRGECKRAGLLFEPKDKPKKELKRWLPY